MKRKSKFRDHQEENGKSNIKELLFRVFNLRFSVLSLINKRYEYNKHIFFSRNEKQASENLAKSMSKILENIKIYMGYEYGGESHRENNSNKFAVDVTSPYKTTEGRVTFSNHTKISARSSNSIQNNFVVICDIGGLSNNDFGK